MKKLPTLFTDVSWKINEIKPNSNIYLIENFLSDIECDKIMKSEWDLKSGGVYSSDGNSYVDEYYRKCSALSIDIPTLKQKISNLVNWPIDKSESCVLMHYKVGDFFKPHSDYIDHLPDDVNRNATLILYLNTPEKGGETIFPSRQIKVPAIKGNALFYNYTADRKEMHAGCRIKEGEKWIITQWFREKDYINK